MINSNAEKKCLQSTVQDMIQSLNFAGAFMMRPERVCIRECGGLFAWERDPKVSSSWPPRVYGQNIL